MFVGFAHIDRKEDRLVAQAKTNHSRWIKRAPIGVCGASLLPALLGRCGYHRAPSSRTFLWPQSVRWSNQPQLHDMVCTTQKATIEATSLASGIYKGVGEHDDITIARCCVEMRALRAAAADSGRCWSARLYDCSTLAGAHYTRRYPCCQVGPG